MRKSKIKKKKKIKMAKGTRERDGGFCGGPFYVDAQ